jgi:hypothetical protein
MSLMDLGQDSEQFDQTRYLKLGDAVQTSLGRVTRSTGGEFALARGGDQIRGVAPGLYDSDGLYLASLDGWLVALGEEGTQLQSWRQGEANFAELANVERIVFGGYDPGGFHRVRILRLPLNRLLLETEESVTLIDREQGLVWALDHGDPTTKVVRISADRVVIMNEYDYTALRLADRTFMESEPHD